MLDNIRIVLVETSHAGNVGAAARAMKNMCLESLWLVSPKRFPSADATARASGADDLLARARVCTDLGQALRGCRLVLGTSARPRSIAWPQLSPRECAEKLVAESARGEVALLFGRESSGLSNDELDRCSHLVQIPTGAAYSSLNLAAAVQILAYEIYLASLGHREPAAEERPPAPAEAMQGFFRHLEQTLRDIGFSDPKQSTKLHRRLRRLFYRARPDDEELSILRGILSAAQRSTVG